MKTTAVLAALFLSMTTFACAGEDGSDGQSGVNGAVGETGATGSDGAVGPRGEKGERGETGESGVVALTTFSGPVAKSTIVVADEWTLVGQSVSLKIPAGYTVSVLASGVLGKKAPSAEPIGYHACARDAQGATIPFNAEYVDQVFTADEHPISVTTSKTFDLGGTYDVGVCVKLVNDTADVKLDNSDVIKGIALITR